MAFSQFMSLFISILCLANLLALETFRLVTFFLRVPFSSDDFEDSEAQSFFDFLWRRRVFFVISMPVVGEEPLEDRTRFGAPGGVILRIVRKDEGEDLNQYIYIYISDVIYCYNIISSFPTWTVSGLV